MNDDFASLTTSSTVSRGFRRTDSSTLGSLSWRRRARSVRSAFTARRIFSICDKPQSRAPERSPSQISAIQDRAASSFSALLAVQTLTQPIDPLTKLLRRHAGREVVHVEQRAEVPSSLFNDSTLVQEPIVKRRSWE